VNLIAIIAPVFKTQRVKGIKVARTKQQQATNLKTRIHYNFLAMSSSKVVVGLNDDAIKFLKNGNYRAALWSLDMAVGRLRAGLHRSEDESSWRTSRQNCLSCFTKTSNLVACAEELCDVVKCRRQPFEEEEEDDDDDSENGNNREEVYPTRCISISNKVIEDRAREQQISGVVFEFFPRAFVTETPSGYGLCDNPTREFVILTYNMALVYHYEAMCTGKASKYVVALNIYEMCLCFIDSMWNEVSHDDLLLLLLALYNNMGHAHSHLLNVEESRQSLASVRDLILSSLESQESLLSEEDYKFFATTVVVFEGQECCCAPVA